MTWTDADIAQETPIRGNPSQGWTDEDVMEKDLGLGYAPLDVGLNLATGFGAQTAAGLRGGYGLLQGDTGDEASRKIRETADKYTWQPRGRAGQAALDVIAKPLEWATKGAEYVGGGVGEAVGGEQGRIAGESIAGAAVPMGLTVLGGRALMKSAPTWQANVQEAFDTAKQQRTAEFNALKYPESKAQGLKLDAAAKAQEHGIALNPYDVSRSTKNAAMEMGAGGADLGTTLSLKNEPLWADLARRDMGIQDAQITIGSLNDVRARHSAPYQELSKIPPLAADARLLDDVSGVNNLAGLTPQAAEIVKKQMPQFSNDIATAAAKGLSGYDIVELTKRFREEAASGFASGNVEAIAMARAKRAAADALDNFAERKLAEMDTITPGAGYAQLVGDLRNSRREIAKSYAYQGAIDLNTGKLDPLKIARQTSEANPFTGILADIGAIAGNFPNIAKVGSVERSVSAPRLYRSGMAGSAGFAAGLAVGAPIEGAAIGALAGFIGSGKLRKRIASPEFQRSMDIADYRPMSERGNFVGPQMGVRAAQPVNPVPQQSPLPVIEDAPIVPGSWRESPPAEQRLPPSFAQGLPSIADDFGQPVDYTPLNTPHSRQSLPSFAPEGAPVMMDIPGQAPATLRALIDDNGNPLPIGGGSEFTGGLATLLDKAPGTPRGGITPSMDARAAKDVAKEAHIPDRLSIEAPTTEKIISDLVETIPFDTKFDVANHSLIVKATHAFIDEAAALKSAIAAETNGFKKSGLEAKLRGTENRFMAGWKELGFKNEAQLRNLTQKLYQYGGETQRGVEKMKSLKDLI